MTTKLITTAVVDPKNSALKARLTIIGVFLSLGGLSVLAAYNLAHHPELLGAITRAAAYPS